MVAVVNYPGGTPIKRNSGGRAAGSPAFDILEGVFDGPRYGSAGIGDVITLMTIPANTFVGHAFLEVVKGEAGVTIAVGDAATPAGWVVAAAVGTVDGVMTHGTGTYNTAGGKLYTADTDIILTTGVATLELAVLRVVLLVATLG